jgi:predicted regulator of Ras-like GTPase activity (Roadblock/LC7/MglB family)
VFTEQLAKVVDNVEGGIGGLIMGLDGIAVETYIRNGQKVDLNTIGMEFSFILTQVRKASEILRVGNMSEFTIKAEQLMMVIRMLTDEYFLAVALGADGNFGKCRFLMRMVAPRLTQEL